jgi:predicted nucleic acid-binding protein
MEITREVILDLMPLYVAGEVSDDTRKLVEAYLEHDEDLKRLAEHAEKTGLKEVPMSNQKELSLEAYEKANRMMVVRTLVLAAIISVSFLALLALGGALAAFFLIP